MFSKHLPTEKVQTPKRSRSVTVRLGWVSRGRVSCQSSGDRVSFKRLSGLRALRAIWDILLQKQYGTARTGGIYHRLPGTVVSRLLRDTKILKDYRRCCTGTGTRYR